MELQSWDRTHLTFDATKHVYLSKWYCWWRKERKRNSDSFCWGRILFTLGSVIARFNSIIFSHWRSTKFRGRNIFCNYVQHFLFWLAGWVKWRKSFRNQNCKNRKDRFLLKSSYSWLPLLFTQLVRVLDFTLNKIYKIVLWESNRYVPHILPSLNLFEFWLSKEGICLSTPCSEHATLYFVEICRCVGRVSHRAIPALFSFACHVAEGFERSWVKPVTVAKRSVLWCSFCHGLRLCHAQTLQG